MIRAFSYIFGISLALVAISAAIVISLRFIGSQQSHTSLDHPILRESSYFIAKGGGGGDQFPSNSLSAFKHTSKEFPSAWLEADLRLTNDNNWVLYEFERLPTLTNGKGRIKYHNLADIQKLKLGLKEPYGKIITLETLLNELPNSRFVLDIHTQDTSHLQKIVDLVKQHNLQEKVIIQSSYQLIIDEFKKLEPRWIYGSGTRPLMKARLFTSIYLETMIDLPADIIFAPISEGGLPPLSERLAIELYHRKKPIVLELKNLNELKNSSLIKYIKGIMISDLSKEVFELLPQ